MSANVWVTPGGRRYHQSPRCDSLRSGEASAGRGTYPVRRSTEETARAQGFAPCSKCLPDVAESAPPQWRAFLNAHAAFLTDTPFEREFVVRVLANVAGLLPGEVKPQQEFLSGDGRQRRIDFAIVRGDARVAIEIDGHSKVPGQTGMTAEEQADWLRRQNDMVMQGWKPLRYTNMQVMGESARCAREIAEAIAIPKPPDVFPPGAPPNTRQSMPGRARYLAYAAVVAAIVVAVAILIAVTRAGSKPGVAPSGSTCPSDHPIKGNNSISGAKIYHEPGDEFYSRTRPERCFKDASEAESAGYRAPRN